MAPLLYRLDDPTRAAAAGIQPGIKGEIIDFSPFSLIWLVPTLRAGGFEHAKGLALMLWAIFLRVGKAREFRVYAYRDAGVGILHYSVVSPTRVHMPWLEPRQAGTEIGGCLTIPSARGKKIYPSVLANIAGSGRHPFPLYMIVDGENISSRRGIENAGFERVCSLSRKSGGMQPPRYELMASN